VNVVGELQRKRTLAASRGFLAAARLSCTFYRAEKVGLKVNRNSEIINLNLTITKHSCKTTWLKTSLQTTDALRRRTAE